MNDTIKVNYKVHATDYIISKALHKLDSLSMVSFDLETQSLYSIEQKKEARELLKGELSYEDKKLCKLAARSSGLSNPRLIKATHFIFGISKEESIICIANSRRTEKLIFNWLAKYKGKVLIWNSLFDLKIMYERVKALPIDYEDPMLLLKSLINDVEDWNAKVGLKDFMGGHYDNKWCLIDTYDIVDYKDKNFIRYCAIDGAATYYGYELIQEQINGSD
ncbi:MAG: hypothetical protein KAI79_04290 [Bacteroidales bacterium]|nr:hypothetical protein [Bacteroidales bacterium]